MANGAFSLIAIEWTGRQGPKTFALNVAHKKVKSSYSKDASAST